MPRFTSPAPPKPLWPGNQSHEEVVVAMSNPTRLHVPALAITLRTTPEPEVKQEVLKYLRSQGLTKTPGLADKVTSLALDRAGVAETAPIRADLKRLIANAGSGLLEAIQRAPQANVVAATKPLELSADELKFWVNLPEGFRSTADIEAPEQFIGQERLREALNLGLSMDGPDYNVLLSGLSGKAAVDRLAAEVLGVAFTKPVPDDQVFVPNFDNALEPKAIRVPAGKGCELRAHIEDLARFIEKDLPGQLQKAQGAEDDAANAAKGKAALEKFQDAGKRLGLVVKKSGDNVAVIPAGANGEPITPEQMSAMSDADKAELSAKAEQLKGAMTEYVAEMKKLAEAGAQQLAPAAEKLLAPKLTAIVESMGGSASVKEYLDAVQADIIRQLPSIKNVGDRYAVNVTVDNSKLTHAPVVMASDATIEGLFGATRLNPESKSLGVNDIEVGDLAKANGGYLVIDLDRMGDKVETLTKLMNSLAAGEINMARVAAAPPVPVRLRPGSFGLDVKVIAIASGSVANAVKTNKTIAASDVFKASADFDSTLPNNDDNAMAYAGRIGEICRAQGLPHFDKSAVAAILEHSARSAGSTNVLVALPSNLADVVREAAQAAGRGAEIVTGADVTTALKGRMHRANLGQKSMLARIIDGTKLIDVTGAKVGQINGLAVLQGAQHTFGLPSRITASIAVGQAGLINVERQADKSGPSHNKGIEILQGYLRERFGSDKPLTLTASIAFEQMYGGIDGDSASSTELYAMLSKLSGMPIRQGTAVTGSVNQWGEVQPIGGVNHKVEGFFDVCKARGLTGDQGVMVPISNMKDLILRPDVVEAIEKGEFHIYPVKTIDQGIEILTGVAAGDVKTPGTINYLADQRLRALAGALDKKDEAAE